MSNSYVFGTDVRVEANYKDENDADIDPADVTCLVRDPDGTETPYLYGTSPTAIVRDAEGKYHLWLSPDKAGEWFYRWKGAGGVRVANEASFEIEASEFTAP